MKRIYSIFCLVASMVFSSALNAQATLNEQKNVIRLKGLANDMRSVGVVDTQGRFFLLADSEIHCRGISFVENGEIVIDIKRSVGVRWNNSAKRHVEYVFSTGGDYKIVVSDNLETEQENSKSRTFRLRLAPSEHKDEPALDDCSSATSRS